MLWCVAARQGHSLSFSGARLGLLTNHFCGVSQDSFSLTADGNVSACYEVFLETLPRAERFYGRFDADEQQFRFELPVLNKVPRRQTVDQHPFCDGCFAKWSCGGDCYHKAMAVNGTPEFKGTDRCHLIRELTQDRRSWIGSNVAAEFSGTRDPYEPATTWIPHFFDAWRRTAMPSRRKSSQSSTSLAIFPSGGEGSWVWECWWVRRWGCCTVRPPV